MLSEDLAHHHHPLTELFPQPSSPGEWAEHAIRSDQIRHFEEHGFVSGIPVLDGQQVELLREQLARLMNPSHPGHSLFYEFHSNESIDPETVLFHALGGWRIEDGFHDLLYSPILRMTAFQLLGAAVRFFHDQLFCKPPAHGGAVSWHQDYSYWTWTQPMAHLTCWIALDDATIDNGCLHYVPGSHRWGLLPVTGLAGDMKAVEQVLDRDQRSALDRQVPATLRAGEAVFHHPLVMHGSYQNRSQFPRRGAVVNFAADGVWSHPEALEGPGSDRFPILPEGQPLAGRFYPLLFDPEREMAGEIDSIPHL